MAPFYVDDFNGTNGTLLENHTPDTGDGWTKLSGDANNRFELSGNRLRPEGGQGCRYVNDTDPPSADYALTFDVDFLSDANYVMSVGIRFHVTADTGYYFQINDFDNEFRLYKTVTGTDTLLDSAAINRTDATFVFSAITNGGNVDLLVTRTGSEILSATDSSSPITAAGHLHLEKFGGPGANDGSMWENFSAEEIGGGGDPPVNTVAPAVTGTPTEGYELSCTEGTWDNEPDSFAYQWYRDDGGGFDPIGGATVAAYTLVSADVDCDIKCNVEATNEDGSDDADSNTVENIGPFYDAGSLEARLDTCVTAALMFTPGDGDAPTNVTPPAIAGTPTVGQLLTVTPGEWSEPPDELTYQWQRDTGGGFENIAGATNDTYTLQEADDTADIRVLETAHAGSASSDPEASNVIEDIGPLYQTGTLVALLEGRAVSDVTFTPGDRPERTSNGRTFPISVLPI